ncbi:hypothetical protein BJV74DRAFT_135243 [Russula compacta]|nr:hypothetical protein BJV74DRAFT_135243 [Russula compacta]
MSLYVLTMDDDSSECMKEGICVGCEGGWMDGIVGLPPLVALNPHSDTALHNTEQNNSSWVPPFLSLCLSLPPPPPPPLSPSLSRYVHFSDRHRKLFGGRFRNNISFLAYAYHFFRPCIPSSSPRPRPLPCLYRFSVSSHSHSRPCVPVLVLVPVISPLPFSSPMLLPPPPLLIPPYVRLFFFSLLSPSKKNQKKKKMDSTRKKSNYIYNFCLRRFVL